MIITHFPNTLGGVSFEKAGKLFRGGKPTFPWPRLRVPP